MKNAYYTVYKSFDYTILKKKVFKKDWRKHMEMVRGFERVIGSQVVFLFLYFS